MELVKAVLSGNQRAIARLITRIENNEDDAHADLAQIYPHAGRAHVIGVTGASGAGKSTLVNELVKAYRTTGQRIGVVAVDPTSPFSGGAILGDRIRMRDLTSDPGVFIRSMATRGSRGGLARATADAVKVLDAARFDVIIVETVGAGQSEVEIAQTAHTIVVVEAPGMGDEVQAIKAGLFEIADVFAVNKADHHGADQTVAALQMMLDLGHAVPSQRVMHHSRLMEIARSDGQSAALEYRHPDSGTSTGGEWRPPVVKTVATRGDGIPELAQAITDHRRYLEATNELAHRNQVHLVNQLERILRDGLMDRLLSQVDRASLSNLMAQVAARTLDPYTAARQLMEGDSHV
jgi:LAO/AO transport system kinase